MFLNEEAVFTLKQMEKYGLDILIMVKKEIMENYMIKLEEWFMKEIMLMV